MSYYRFLGMEREPFSTNPDPAFFYQSVQYRDTLANLMIEFRLKRGLSVVLGDIGIGKTTLGRKLIQMLREREHFVFHMVLDPTYPSEELFFHDVTRTLGVELSGHGLSLVDYRDALQRFLFTKAISEGQTIVLLIDEAHKLNGISLEALRILLNYETNDAKLLQVVLLGQMELLPVLMEMPNLVDRVSFKSVLQPLTLAETQELIDFRLDEAGYRSRMALFSPEAVQAIHEHTDGYPRRIAMVCHQALRHVVMRRDRAVEAGLIHELIHDEVEAGWLPLKGDKRLQQSSC